MKHLGIVGAVVAACLSSAALAQEEPPVEENSFTQPGGQFYIAPRLNFGISDVSDFRLDPDQGGTLVQKQDGAEFVAGASIAFGYKWDTDDLPLRIEGQYYYRYHYDLNLRLDAAQVEDYDNETTAHAGLIQGYWHGGVGIWWDFSENFTLDLGYRYLDLGDLDTDNFPSGESVDTSDYATHDIYVGVAYRF